MKLYRFGGIGMHWLSRTLFILTALFIANTTWAEDAFAGKPLILAVHPYLPHDEIVSRFKPLADYLARSIGRPVEVRVGTNYEEHIAAIGTDSVDIAYMGPVPYVKLVARYGRKPLLARQEVGRQPFLKGEIIVRQDSALQSLSELKGKRFLFGDADSTMGTIVPQLMLDKAGVPINSLSGYQFLKGHDNVAMGVLAGDYDAGAVKDEVFQKFAPQGLRALAHAPQIYDHLFVTSARLPVHLVDSLRSQMLKLNDTAEGRAIMASIHSGMTALVYPKDNEYNNLREIMAVKMQVNSH